MADSSDDEFGSYGPTTPAAPPKKARQRAGSARPVAGPSTKPASRTGASKKPPSKMEPAIELDEDEDSDIVMVDQSKKRKNDQVDEAAQEPAKGGAKKAPAPSRTTPAVNGATKSTATKGKARAEPPGKPNGETMELDGGDVIEVEEHEPPDVPPGRAARGGARQTKARNGVQVRQTKQDEQLARENEKLRAEMAQMREAYQEMVGQRDQVAALRDKLASQLEEVFHLRRTEAEEALAEYKEHFEESMKRREDLIQELTAHLTKLQGPAHSNQSSTLQFITREQADDEKRALQEETDRYKELIKQRDARLEEKDRQINALQAEILTISKERDAEIERSKTIAARSGPAASGLSSQVEKKNAPVIRLYEDMTNILVTNLKYEKSEKWPELDEELAACVYTYNYSDGEDDQTWSLSFTLRLIWDLPDGVPNTGPVSRSELVQKMMYQPTNLEYEPPEYVARLGFFKSAFMFSRGQMSVFIRTLGESVANVFDGEEAGGTTEILMDGSA